VNPGSVDAARAERREAVFVLQPAETPFHSRAATIEALALIGAVRDRVSGIARRLPRQMIGTTPRSRVSSIAHVST
jgi:hypothetical protein